MTPFDFVNDASFDKKNLMRDSENDALAEKSYNAYLANLAFSQHLDSILHANRMNERHYIPARAAYEYYINSLRRRRRFAPWAKKTQNEQLEVVCRAFNCRAEIGKQYLQLLSEQQIHALKQQQEQ